MTLEAGHTSGRGDGFDDLRHEVLSQALMQAPFDGWTALMLRQAGDAAGVDRGTMKILFPDGIRDVLRFWSESVDEVMVEAMSAREFKDLKIREKVARAVTVRLEALEPHKEAARRAAALFALPSFAPVGARLTWKIADRIWRGLGDKSTDFNFYSKRTILSGVWSTTFARWLADDSDELEATKSFLADRIANVMQIEKFKAQVQKTNIDPLAPLKILSKIRYRQSGVRN